MERLEAFYVQFNTARPEDFRGHSLSVSDIVALKVGGVVSCHYVDSIGFKELEGFALRENYLKNAEMAWRTTTTPLMGSSITGERTGLWRSGTPCWTR